MEEASRKIGKAQKNESFTGGTSKKIKLDERMHRNVKYTVESESGYWNCSEMKYAGEFCLALFFLGEKNSQTASTLANPRFSECCLSGKVTQHILLISSCVECRETFREKGGLICHTNPREACIPVDT